MLNQAILDRASAQADRAAEACEQPFWPNDRVRWIAQPLFAPAIVTRCFPVAPGFWRIDWMIPGPLDTSPTTGSARAELFELAEAK